MGNGSSQSVLLGPPPSRYQAPYVGRGVPRYAHPQNRVLPKPVAGQRLRTTDNGSILQTAGTIRGLRREDSTGKADADPEVMGILRRRSEMIEKENDCYHHLNLRNHRLFHSDPNIARRPDDSVPEHHYANGGNSRTRNSGAAMRTSKLKYKKKAKAPQPPLASLPRKLERNASGDIRSRSGAACKCIAKSRAPQPPEVMMHPPPPPPLPEAVTTRTVIRSQPVDKNVRRGESGKSMFNASSTNDITRAVECAADSSRTSYEKKVHPLEKWRHCKSVGDIRIDECQDDYPNSSRTTVFDSRKLSGQNGKSPSSYLPVQPDPFQKEISEVTKKIAQGRQQLNATTSAPLNKSYAKIEPTIVKIEPTVVKIEPKVEPPKPAKEVPKFFFADQSVFKVNQKTDSSSSAAQNFKSESSNPNRDGGQQHKVDEIVPSLQRFSPARRRVKTPSPGNSNRMKTEQEWDNLSKNLFSKQNSEPDIDLRLRPVLPRKPAEAPRPFSPAEAWRALGSDGSHRSTSDDGHFHRPTDRDFGLWTPRQDLLDDSDVSGQDSEEEAVVPRLLRPAEISTRFSLPSVMFSNMRPIGSELSARSQSAHSSYAKKKPEGHLRKFLNRRSRFMSEEDITTAPDPNWTFGLQKCGKRYSSEMLLTSSDRRHRTAGDDLGDVMVSKADHLRRQMRTSDFSFYSTEGQVAWMPERGGFVSGRTPSPRRRSYGADTPQGKIDRRREAELAKMLEDEVRRRRNKEKVSIRQQLQRLKGLRSDEDDECDDEAYFTEPKSQSPFPTSDLGVEPTRFSPGITAVDSSRLSHWQSSPALLEDAFAKGGMQPSTRGRLSLSSVMSSPDSGAWIHRGDTVDSWLRRQQPPPSAERLTTGRQTASSGDGDVSSSPTPAPKKERRKTSVYQQLMDIVRKEERHLRNAQRDRSQRESSSSPSSATTSSTSSFSDSSSGKRRGGVPANREFGYRTSFPVAFAQPYSPGKGYRPVAFEPPTSVFRLPGVKEEGKITTKVS